MSNAKLPLIATGTFLIGVVVGGMAAGRYVEQKLIEDFEERLEKETSQIKDFYAGINKPGTPAEVVAERVIQPTETQVADAVKEFEQKRGGSDKVPYHRIKKNTKRVTSTGAPQVVEFEEEQVLQEYDDVVAVTKSNVFETAGAEEPIRVISGEEYEAGDKDYIQSTLTYYSVDNILTDDREEKIEDFEGIIGKFALRQFGVVSGDPHVVHVRNNILEIDYEIVKSEGAYVVEVLGLEYEPPVQRPSDRLRQSD